MMRAMQRLPRPPLLVCLLLVAAVVGRPAVASDTVTSAPIDEPGVSNAAPLDGVILSEDEAAEVNGRLPVAVMVDNAPGGARPQIGLDRADLVYELLVESGITRFLAVYLRREAEWVEPVRSVRTPFLYLVLELDAVLAHVGAAETEGDTDAGNQMAEWGVRHLEERYNPAPFWRDRARRAPHNAATSIAGLRAEAEEQGWRGPGNVAPWLYKDDLTVANPSSDVVGHIAFAWGEMPQADFAVEWRYDQDINGYRRWMAGRPHTDGRTGATLSAKNVIVQFDHAEVVNHEGHVLYGSVGEGPAYIFLDGQVIEAVWSKTAREERTRYYDLNGDEIRFNRGNTWVAILPYGSPLSWD
jgi:hypothetical protein